MYKNRLTLKKVLAFTDEPICHFFSKTIFFHKFIHNFNVTHHLFVF